MMAVVPPLGWEGAMGFPEKEVVWAMLEVRFAYWLPIWHSIQTEVVGSWVLLNIFKVLHPFLHQKSRQGAANGKQWSCLVMK